MPVKNFTLLLFCITGLMPGSFKNNKDIFYIRQPAVSLQFSIDYTATTHLLHPPYISGVVNDVTDPAATIGFVVAVKENNVPVVSGSYTLSASSDNESVVHNNNIIIDKKDGLAIIKIIPSEAGYSDITFKLIKDKKEEQLTINYAASVDPLHTTDGYWHTGISDASAAVVLDSDYMVVADDEINALFVYHRYQSGLPVAMFNYQNLIKLNEGGEGSYKEVDCEAGTRSIRHPERIYWTGSMSNGGSHLEERPNRSCLFATDINGTGSATKFELKGYYNSLRRQLIKWGNANGYKLSAASASGESPKKIDGFNIEGIAFAPDSNTLYICFRAPIVPVTNRTKALIAPIQNFETWFNEGNPAGNPSIGAPIELNLGGRGIREMIRLNNGSYVIIAGNSNETLNGALYTWTGNAADQPVLANASNDIALKAEAGIEIDDANGKFTGKVQILADNGTAIYYNDGQYAKYLQTNFKKFHSNVVNLYSPENK